MNDSFYDYDPLVTAAILFAVLYVATFLGTFIMWIRYRAWVWFLMVVAAAMEALGYLARIISTKHVTERTVFIVQFSLIILSPIIIAAALYIIFGRMIFHVLPPSARTFKTLWVPPRFVTPIFVVCDILAFFVQLIGAVLVAGTQPTDKNAERKLKEGKNIVLAGLALQISCFGLFTVIAVRFHFTSKRFAKEFDRRVGGNPADRFYSIDDRKRKLQRKWSTLLTAVNVGCVLILVRSVYRVVDFGMGKDGYMDRHEYFFYLLDALPILPCVAIFLWYHPGKYLPYLGFRLPKHIRGAPGDYHTSIPLTLNS